MSEKHKPVEKIPGYLAVIEQIRKLVVEGQLCPGDRLPPERKLAESLSVSRSILRRALQALGEKRIIESRQGNGTYLIADSDAFTPVDSLLSAINRQDENLGYIIELRQLIEPQIAALAAQRVTPQLLDRLKILVCDQQNVMLQGKDGNALDATFHRLLTKCCANPVLIQVMATIQSLMDETRSTWLQSNERTVISVDGHLRIIQALEARDAAAAYKAMQSHITAIEGHVFGDDT